MLRRLFLTMIVACAARADRLLTPADVTAFREMSECTLSPDGRTVAVVAPDGNIRLYDTAGSGSRALTEGKFRAASLRWSPDGKNIAFFSSRPGATLWVAEAALGKLVPVTTIVHSNFWIPGQGSALEWSPDSKRLAFVGADPETPAPGADPRVITRIQYKSRKEFSDNRREHIWIVDAGGGRPRALTGGEHHEHSISWSGKRIAFISDRQPDPDATHNYDLFTADVESGAVRRLTDTPGCEYAPAFSPDGQWIAYTATTRAITTIDSVAEDTHVWVIPASGGGGAPSGPRELNHALDRRSTAPRWSPDGRWIYFLAGDHGRQLIYRVPFQGGTSQAIVQKDATISAYAAGPKLAYLMSDDRRLAELYVEGAQLTENSGALAGIRLVDPVHLEFSSFDSTPIEGWLLPPVDRREGQKVPLLLSIHGGPHGMFGYAFSRNLRQQVLATRGYAVLYLNPRGSTGYGQKFSDGCVNDWGGGDYKDLMAGVDYALGKFPWLDRERMGVLGGSYGGYMTNWVITQTQRFRAAVASASLSNLISFYATSLYNDLIHAEFNGFPWEGDNYDRLWDRSPLKHVKNVRTPTLFLHGEQDHDVHISDAEQMYTALRRRGIEAELVRYPREGHGFTEPPHQVDSLERTLEWLDRFVK